MTRNTKFQIVFDQVFGGTFESIDPGEGVEPMKMLRLRFVWE